MSDFDRSRGALFGLAVGDALGTSQEFSLPKGRKPFPELNLGPQTEIVGGGPFHLPAGHTTDDTQMAVCLMDSLQACAGFDPRDLSKRYIQWMQVAFDIGNQTRAALMRVSAGARPEDAGFEVWQLAEHNVAGNGSLMRTAPIGVYFATDPWSRRQASLLDSAITHADPRCQLACAALNAAIAHAIRAPHASPETMLKAAIVELAETELIDPRLPEPLVRSARAELSEDLAAAARLDPDLDLHRHQGFVRVAFRLAFWELTHAGSFEAGVLDATNRGGDADTNAAISGALLGALHGERGIPERWRKLVEVAGAEGPLGAASATYDPRRLVSAFVET